MTILDQKSMMVSAAMNDAFGAATPTTEAGLVRDAGQTGIFIYATVNYTLYLKDAGGNWSEYAAITAERESITVPWDTNTAAFFKCDDATATLHVHAKTGTILYDSTPGDEEDANNTLLASGAALATEAVAYTFPATDGNDGEALVTNGAGQLDWMAVGSEGGGLKTLKAALADGVAFTWGSVDTAHKIAWARILTSNYSGTPLDTTTYDFTVPADGYYDIDARIALDNIQDDTAQYQTIIATDSATSETWTPAASPHDLENIHIFEMSQFDPPSSQTIIRLNVSTTAYLTAGMKVSVYLRQIGGTTTANIKSIPMQTSLVIKAL